MRTCSRCKVAKEEEDFYNHKRPSNVCIECWQESNTRGREELAAWMRTLKERPCTDCEIEYPPHVMHWDHLPNTHKYKSVSRLRSEYAKRDKILEEISKCELVCANCHAMRTWNRKQEPA